MIKIVEVKKGINRMEDLGFSIPIKITGLWTVCDEDEMWNHYNYNPDNGKKVVRGDLSTLKLSHNHGVFKECMAYYYDVDYNEKTLWYSSCVLEDEDEGAKVVIEYEPYHGTTCNAL